MFVGGSLETFEQVAFLFWHVYQETEELGGIAEIVERFRFLSSGEVRPLALRATCGGVANKSVLTPGERPFYRLLVLWAAPPVEDGTRFQTS